MLKKLVFQAVQLNASDIHVEPHLPITFRIFGALKKQSVSLTPEALREMVRTLVDADGWGRLNSNGSVDTSLVLAGVQCRLNIMKTDRGLGLAIRLLSQQNHSLASCNLHPSLADLLKAPSGLILLTGSTGAGKSTTLSAMIEEINNHEQQHIITLEKPIEYRFTSKKSLIRQRQVGLHTPSFEIGILDALREDPDVLVVGEMRDPETIRLALNAAETGHLVLATLHSANAAEAIYRIMMSFSPEHQFSVLAQLAETLVGVVSQKLMLQEKLNIQIPICEILLNTLPVRNLVRKGEISKLSTILQTGGPDGQWTFERYKAWADQKKDWQLPQAPKFDLVDDGDFPDARLDISSEPLLEPVSRIARPARELTLASGDSSRIKRQTLKAHDTRIFDDSATSSGERAFGAETRAEGSKVKIKVPKAKLRHEEQAEMEMVMSQINQVSVPTKRDPVTGLKVHPDGRFDIPAIDVDLNELVKKIKVEE